MFAEQLGKGGTQPGHGRHVFYARRLHDMREIPHRDTQAIMTVRQFHMHKVRPHFTLKSAWGRKT
jgi:hypothetical protein